jgi:hypothetical protein
MSKNIDDTQLQNLDTIQPLNTDDLDIEELERRLELASATPSIGELYDCGSFLTESA